MSALFHDLGLTKHYRSADKRFEVDGANAARSLLEQHGLSKESTQLVWDAIALHQTIRVAQYKEPVVALLYHGVGFRHKPETTFGNIGSDVCERYLPGYTRPNFCDLVLQSPWNQ
jgi:hypothetical protein